MNTDVARSVGPALMRRRRPGAIAVVSVALAVFALALAPSAWATVSGTATLAPIGAGSYLLSVTNTGDESVGNVALPGNEATKNAVSSSGQCYGFVGTLLCTVELAPSASGQICYSGTAVTEVLFSAVTHVPVTSAPAVSACPLAGFTPVSVGAPGPTAPSGGGASGDTGPVPAAKSPAKCKKGFVKKKAHGKTTCVKRKHKKHKH